MDIKSMILKIFLGLIISALAWICYDGFFQNSASLSEYAFLDYVLLIKYGTIASLVTYSACHWLRLFVETRTSLTVTIVWIMAGTIALIIEVYKDGNFWFSLEDHELVLKYRFLLMTFTITLAIIASTAFLVDLVRSLVPLVRFAFRG